MAATDDDSGVAAGNVNANGFWARADDFDSSLETCKDSAPRTGTGGVAGEGVNVGSATFSMLPEEGPEAGFWGDEGVSRATSSSSAVREEAGVGGLALTGGMQGSRSHPLAASKSSLFRPRFRSGRGGGRTNQRAERLRLAIVREAAAAAAATYPSAIVSKRASDSDSDSESERARGEVKCSRVVKALRVWDAINSTQQAELWSDSDSWAGDHEDVELEVDWN